MGETNEALHLISKRRLGNFAPFYFYLDGSFDHLCLLVIAALNYLFNFNVVTDEKVCYYIIDLPDSHNLSFSLLFGI